MDRRRIACGCSGFSAVLFVVMLGTCFAPRVYGQFDEPIETERKMFTPTRFTVSQREFMFEASYTFTDLRGVPEKHSYPEILMRYGITENIEARFGWNFETEGEREGFGHFSIAGDQDFLYGMKLYPTVA